MGTFPCVHRKGLLILRLMTHVLAVTKPMFDGDCAYVTYVQSPPAGLTHLVRKSLQIVFVAWDFPPSN